MEIADDIPVCCDDDTDAVKLGNGGIEYTCGDCRTTLELDNLASPPTSGRKPPSELPVGE
ncbi:hypothetical protein ACFVT5_43120 [Streptomyces sp. NPDC058001]|uniref:hypothetical protein n=1 Tax=Streptomyces sp. NPDC058001 TaxID=3346300 RepID=UPI0036E84A30